MTQTTPSPAATPARPAAPAKRRKLHFATIDEALAEADRLVTAERDGRLAQLGNWTLGQALGHLATWAEFAVDGYPESLHPPLVVRLIGRLLRNRVLRGPMMAGMRIGRIPGGTVGTDVLSTDDGLRRFHVAMERLRTTPPTITNPVFGRMTHAEWIQLNLRHAELHLGFLVPRDLTG